MGREDWSSRNPGHRTMPTDRMEVGLLGIAAVPPVKVLPALVALPESARSSLAQLLAAHRPGSLSRRELASALADCSPRQRRQALAWLLQGKPPVPDPVDLRRALGTGNPHWLAFRPQPGNPWTIDYLLPEQLDRLAAAHYARRLADGSAVPLGRRGWQFSHNELRRYLLTRDGGICALCGKGIHHQATIEHLVPQALAPLWADEDPLPPEFWLWSMAPAHRLCNERRGCAPRLPSTCTSPQVRLSRAVLRRLLPGEVHSSQETTGFYQLSRLVPRQARKAVWRYLRGRFRRHSERMAHLYRGELLAYRTGRVVALPPVLQTPEAVRWLRRELVAGRVPAPHSVTALAPMPAKSWPQARARLRFL